MSNNNSYCYIPTGRTESWAAAGLFNQNRHFSPRCDHDFYDYFTIDLPDVEFDHDTVLHRKEPTVLQVSCSDDGYLHADIPGIDKPICAATIEELIDMFNDFMILLWEKYALGDDAKMTAKARELKESLLRDYVAVS